jgi:hypothetical protein
MQVSQFEFLIEETIKKYIPVIAEAVAKKIVEQMQQNFDVKYINKPKQDNKNVRGE